MNPYGQSAYQPYRPPRKGMPTPLLVAVVAGPLALIALIFGLLAPSDHSAPQTAAPTPAFSTKAPAPSKADRARAYLRDNFRTASWYPSITDLHYQADQIWVDTSLWPGKKDPASKICSALSGYLLLEQGQAHFGGVRVAASNGERIVWRQGFSGSCH